MILVKQFLDHLKIKHSIQFIDNIKKMKFSLIFFSIFPHVFFQRLWSLTDWHSCFVRSDLWYLDMHRINYMLVDQIRFPGGMLLFHQLHEAYPYKLLLLNMKLHIWDEPVFDLHEQYKYDYVLIVQYSLWWIQPLSPYLQFQIYRCNNPDCGMSDRLAFHWICILLNWHNFPPFSHNIF